MKIETLRLLRCPYCGQPLECVESVQIGDEIEHGILECGCSNFPIVAGIPIFKRDGRLDLMSDTEDTVLRAGPPVRALLELVRSRDFERALLILLIPPLGLPVRLGRLAALLPGRYRERFRDYVATAASARRKRAYRALMAQPATAVDVFDFFFRQLHLWRAEMYNYFAYRFGMPRHLAALSLATLLPTSDKPILDLACGVGHLLHYWAMTRPGHPLIGLDRNFFLVWVARNWMVPGADYVCADADQTLPFDRGSLSDAHCSDAFHYFFQKVQCVSELQRVVDEAGVIVLSRVGNVLVKRNEGRELKPEEYANLFDDRHRRLVPDRALLDRYLGGRGPALANPVPVEALAGEKWFSLVASRNRSVFRDHGQFETWPHGVGLLKINPLYDVHRSGAASDRLELAFPSPGYESANADCLRYLPRRLEVSQEIFRDLETESRSTGVRDLIRQCVVLGVPRRFC